MRLVNSAQRAKKMTEKCIWIGSVLALFKRIKLSMGKNYVQRTEL